MDEALAKINQHEAECAQFRKHVTYRLDELDKRFVEIRQDLRKAVYMLGGFATSAVGYFEFIK